MIPALQGREIVVLVKQPLGAIADLMEVCQVELDDALFRGAGWTRTSDQRIMSPPL
jgi:hypothetical protein